MQPLIRLLLALGLCVLLAVLFGVQVGSSTAQDTSIWKPLLSEADYKALVEQAARAIQEELTNPAPAAKSANKARGLAVMVAVYAQRSLNRPGAKVGQLSTTRAAAVKLHAALLAKKFAEAKQLAEALPTLKEGTGKPGPVDLHKLSDREDLLTITMQLFAVRMRGGLGLDSRPAKNVDGIEARLIALGRKPLTPAELEKQSEEMARLALVSAMLGEMSHALAPAKDEGKKKRSDWITWSEQMRDAGRQLAEAARAKEPKAVRSAAAALNKSCVACHDVFRSTE